MPSYVPRSLEPYEKNDLVARRERQLMRAIERGLAAEQIRRHAENVRKAHLSVLKAARELVRYTAVSDQDVRRLSNIEREERRWQNLAADTIVAVYARRLTSVLK